MGSLRYNHGIAERCLTDIPYAVQNLTIDMDGFVIADTVCLIPKQDFAFTRKYIENFLTFVRMGWMRPLSRSDFGNMKVELFPVRPSFKYKPINTFDVVPNLFFHENSSV